MTLLHKAGTILAMLFIIKFRLNKYEECFVKWTFNIVLWWNSNKDSTRKCIDVYGVKFYFMRTKPRKNPRDFEDFVAPLHYTHFNVNREKKTDKSILRPSLFPKSCVTFCYIRSRSIYENKNQFRIENISF